MVPAGIFPDSLNTAKLSVRGDVEVSFAGRATLFQDGVREPSVAGLNAVKVDAKSETPMRIA